MIRRNDRLPEDPHGEDEQDHSAEQTEPIEVVPDGSILDGHKRFPEAQLLGYPEVSVLVRALD